jgi:hypothetical protein
MKAELLTLVVALMIGVSHTSAQSKLTVVGVTQVLANPGEYRGLTVAVHGVVNQIAPERKTFTLVDSESGSSARSANARSLATTIQAGSQVVFPSAGQEAIAIGRVEVDSSGAKLFATQVLTNRFEVRQILSQGTVAQPAGKRPGDNLGRDAQPARDQ